jgi:hypothetical protein
VYHCVAGRPPFVRDSVAAMFGAHLFSEAQVPAGRGDRALGPAVATGMSKSPDARHTSCVALMRATGYLPAAAPAAEAAEAAAAAAAAEATPPRQQRTRRQRRARPPRQQRARPPRRRVPQLPISWPVAAMAVLAGIVCTLVLAAMLA